MSGQWTHRKQDIRSHIPYILCRCKKWDSTSLNSLKGWQMSDLWRGLLEGETCQGLHYSWRFWNLTSLSDRRAALLNLYIIICFIPRKDHNPRILRCLHFVSLPPLEVHVPFPGGWAEKPRLTPCSGDHSRSLPRSNDSNVKVEHPAVATAGLSCALPRTPEPTSLIGSGAEKIVFWFRSDWELGLFCKKLRGMSQGWCQTTPGLLWKTAKTSQLNGCRSNSSFKDTLNLAVSN